MGALRGHCGGIGGDIKLDTAGSDDAPAKSTSGDDLTAAPAPGLPEDAYERSSVLALDFLEKLGYDTTLLEVASVENADIYNTGDKYFVLVTDGVGDFAKVLVDTDATRVESVAFKEPVRDYRPEILAPGPDLYERVARQLELPEAGYEYVSWTVLSSVYQYRKYSMIGEWRVCTTMASIVLDEISGELAAINFEERQPFAELNVAVGRDEAIRTAVDALKDYQVTPVHTELIQARPGYHGNPHEEVLWEVYFDNGAWCLVTIDGRGWLSYNVPNPPK